MPIGLDETYRVIISEDPIGLKGGDINFYAYVKNDPANYKDPDGLSGLAIFGGGLGCLMIYCTILCRDHCSALYPGYLDPLSRDHQKFWNCMTGGGDA